MAKPPPVKYQRGRLIMGGTVGAGGDIARALIRQYGYQAGMMAYAALARGVGRDAFVREGLVPPPRTRKSMIGLKPRAR